MSDATDGLAPTVKISKKEIVEALEAWGKDALSATSLARSLHIRQILSKHDRDVSAAMKAQINESLERLNRDQHAALAHIFQKSETVRSAAEAMKTSESSVYRYRTMGLNQLTEEWTQLEAKAYRRYRSLIEERAQLGVSRLFGATDRLTALRDALLAPGDPWLIGLDGIGGIGKTSLALAAILDHATLTRFEDVLWVSARQSQWHPVHGIINAAHPALTYEGFVSRVLDQLIGPRAAAIMSPRDQAAHMRVLLQEKPILVVVDNLETATDQEALLPEAGAVYTFSLDELPLSDAVDLLRYELQNRNLLTLAAAPDAELAQTHDVTGGNPLAIKLVAGQLSAFPLSRVLDDLRQARGTKVDKFYRYIYWQAWKQLDEDARDVLLVMPLVAEEGGGLHQIEAVSQLPAAQVTDALQQLIRLSLVNVRHTGRSDAIAARDASRYSIHRLTESFLLEEVIRWQAEEAAAEN
jgi:hypothetical protein